MARKKSVVTEKSGLNSIRQLQQVGRVKEAEEQCRLLYTKDPGDMETRILFALIQVQLNSSNEEVGTLLKSISAPDSMAGNSDYGLLQLLRGDLETATKHLECACEQPDVDYAALARLGSARLLQGKFQEAETLFRDALERSPEHPAILSNLGGVLMRQDKGAEALEAYEAALRLDPELVPAQEGRAAALLIENRAIELLQEIDAQLEKDPASIPLRHKKLQILLIQEHYEEARDVLRDLIELQPDEVSYFVQLLNLYIREDQYQMVIKELKSIASKFPDNIELLNIKARALKELGKPDEALIEIEKAISIDQDSPRNLVTRAMVLADKEDYQGAEQDLRQVIEERPGLVEAWTLLGHTLLWRGRIDEAVECLEKAAQINPAAMAALVEARVIPDDPEVIKNMERFAGHSFIPREARASMNFALTKVYEKQGQYNKAFEHADVANKLLSEFITFDPQQHSELTRQIIEVFNKDLFEKYDGLGNYSERPVFVVGMPRSGTTLTEQIIASHDQAFGAGELGVINAVTRLMPSVLKTKLKYPECMQRVTERTIQHASNYYLKALNKRNETALRVVDKLPHNFMHLGLISILFPYARIIHVKRNVHDIAISNYFTNFKMKRQGMGYAFKLENIAYMINDYLQIMEHWRKVIPDNIFEFNYEDLVAEPDRYEHKLLEYLALDWSDKVTDFYQTERAVRTASVWQVRQPIYSSSTERWRNYKEFLNPLMTALNQ